MPHYPTHPPAIRQHIRLGVERLEGRFPTAVDLPSADPGVWMPDAPEAPAPAWIAPAPEALAAPDLDSPPDLADDQPATPTAVPSLLDFASVGVLKNALYVAPNRMASQLSADGAVSTNADWEAGTSSSWYIEQQRYGADLIQAGLITNNAPLTRQGWQVLDWGFARQAADGSFPGTGDAFHSTSLFVEAAARALLLSKQANAPDYADLSARYAPKIESAALWLARPDIAAAGQRTNQPFGHRRWVLAAALGEAGEVTGDDALTAAAVPYARDGLALQDASGMTPERGGGDVNYQAFGALMAERYLAVCRDPTLLDPIRSNISASLRWEMGSIDAEGTVSTDTSTRTGQEVGRSGAIKTADYKTILQAFAIGSEATDTPAFQGTASRLALGRRWIYADGRTRF